MSTSPQAGGISANSSVLGRLLEEISWEGSNVRGYRDGGRGRENVLTAEVLAPLSYLPRDAFLAEVFRAAHGADVVRERVALEAEDAEFTLLPDESRLSAGGTVVQPDGLITTPSCRVLVEAKGMGRSSFQAEQLSREYACVTRDAGSLLPMLLLVVPAPPPVPVKGHGRVSIEDAIRLYLGTVAARTSGLDLSVDELAERIGETVSWITWEEIQTVVASADDGPVELPGSVAATVRRLRDDVVRAIDWHAGRS